MQEQCKWKAKIKYSFLDILAVVCEDTFIFNHDIGNKAFKNLKQHYKVNGIAPWIHGQKGSRAPKAISFNDIENVFKFIKSMFCLWVVRQFFLWDLPFSLHLPTESAQNEWNNLILIIKRYLQTQFEFNPETCRIFEKKNSGVLVIFTVCIFFRLFWRH